MVAAMVPMRLDPRSELYRRGEAESAPSMVAFWPFA